MFKLSISFDLSTLSLFWIPLMVKNYGSSQDRVSIGWNISAVPLQLEKCIIFLEWQDLLCFRYCVDAREIKTSGMNLGLTERHKQMHSTGSS